jgi:hypothetical protein
LRITCTGLEEILVKVPAATRKTTTQGMFLKDSQHHYNLTFSGKGKQPLI